MTKITESSSSKEKLPSYQNPPISEVVCGVRFEPSDKIYIPHIGLLWNEFRTKYPNIQHAPPIASTKGEVLLDPVVGVPLPRVWFINQSDDQLIQFQIDRLYFNWRRRQNDYPRYDHIINNFVSVLTTVAEFFLKLKLGDLKPIEYELSYINHIPKGQGWETIDDLTKVFSDFVWIQSKTRFLPNPDKIAWQAEFPLPENKGNLQINLKQATRTEDNVPLLILELKIRGNSESLDENTIREWFNSAHEWIVKGFTDLTSSKIQKFWRRE